MRTLQIAIVGIAFAALAGCAMVPTVRQSDLDAWKGLPVDALDTHSIFATMPMTRHITPSGIEVRNYANMAHSTTCSGYQHGTRAQCTSDDVGCNNLFYIRDGRVIEYAPTGQCYTDDSARPQQRYLNLSRGS
ncbi:MAG: hypothetical protein JO200_07960 [Comamonas sp.]|nr:hypothetical protein [Comamonas sp.]